VAPSRQDRSGYYEELLRFYDYYGLRRTEKSDLPDHLNMPCAMAKLSRAVGLDTSRIWAILE
jgi:hypothetical protein